jgi:hypothetical protein
MKKLFILAAFVGAMAFAQSANAQEPEKRTEKAKTEKCEKKCDKTKKDCCKGDKKASTQTDGKPDCCKEKK